MSQGCIPEYQTQLYIILIIYVQCQHLHVLCDSYFQRTFVVYLLLLLNSLQNDNYCKSALDFQNDNKQKLNKLF